MLDFVLHEQQDEAHPLHYILDKLYISDKPTYALGYFAFQKTIMSYKPLRLIYVCNNSVGKILHWLMQYMEHVYFFHLYFWTGRALCSTFSAPDPGFLSPGMCGRLKVHAN